MKAWVFLHDVANDEGPFQYVPGSHRLTPQRIAWEKRKSLTDVGKLDRVSQKGSMRIEPRELAELSLPPPQRFAVPANTLVVADTCRFHGRCPSSQSRSEEHTSELQSLIRISYAVFCFTSNTRIYKTE